MLYLLNRSTKSNRINALEYLNGGEAERKYFKLMPAPDVVVLLQAEPQLIIKRIIQRADQKLLYNTASLKVSC